MSELFDEEPKDPGPPQRSNSRGRALVITGVVVVTTLFLVSTFATLYTDRLWFQAVGFGEVFSTMLWTRIGLFLVFGVLMAAAVGVNLYFAYRFRPLFGLGGGDASVMRYRDAITPIRTWLLLGVAGVIGIFAGSSAVGQWRAYLMWRNGSSFGEDDAYFGKDVGFYVFDLPWWHFLVDFAMTATIVALLATAVVHYLYGGIRLQVRHDRLSGAAQVQLSVLLGLFVLFKAVDYWLDRYDLVLTENSLFTGMNFTGENALLPARNILIGVAAICAVLFFLNVWRRTWQLPSVGLALFALSAVLLGMIWPALVQQFQVNPTEADKESDYIAANIAATRSAYDIDDVEMQDYRGIPDTEGVSNLNEQLSKVPVVDPQQVFQTFEQRQQPRVYYSVPPVLDVDRYQIDGEDVPLVLGVREVDPDEVPEPNWTNMHTVYTHGEGVIAAYANQVSADEGNGRMVWAEGIEDAENVFTSDPDFEPRIYYGEMSPLYSVVGKPDEGEDVELGLGLDESQDAEEAAETDRETTYDGAGGVDIGNTFKQLLYGIKFGEPNFLLSGRVHENSKVLYQRSPIERVEAVAPWLTVDRDPYPAVIDGRVQWILDGYTTTDRFPNAQRESLEAMTDDSLQEETGFATVPTDEINYMRSAVKVTVDAYDGSVTLYEWDEEDPILQTWMNVFPDSVQPKDEISDGLLEHLRYPEDLFKAQRYQLAKYHVTNPAAWYGGTDLWEVPSDPEASQSLQPPYRLFTRDVTEEDDSGTNWTLTSSFVPDDRNILAAYVQVDSDATSPTFGEMQVLEMSDNNVPGPGIAANEMQQDQGVRDQLRDFLVSGATPPIFGNVLTLPVSDGLAYIQPVYAVRAASESSFPILQYVIVRYGSDVGIGRNLAGALRDALDGDGAGSQQPEPEEPDTGGEQPEQPEQPDTGGGGSVEQQIDAALAAADQAFRAAEQARVDGDLVERERQLAVAEREFSRAIALIEQRDGNGGGGNGGNQGDSGQ
ncbi:UPF0182 family protein [Nocardioides panacisoli]|uniref:UPF0182 family membrane protein n=1 Tax=Nocardioides panacisoli TaxID=627624 RepID=UPI001C63ADE4|nr:UPF0182 family protein [Nocardioides panacisoli]QYJ05712.1 UPF0182 family protein [Nocardioides panacisoli]